MNDVVEMLSFEHPFFLGSIKAHDTVVRLKTTAQDLEAWKQEKLPRRILLWAVQRFKNPVAYRLHRLEGEREQQMDLSRRDTAEERKDAVVTARAAATLQEGKVRAREAVPPPPEFFEAVSKLKKNWEE